LVFKCESKDLEFQMTVYKLKDMVHQCPFELTLSVLNGKWKPIILFKLMKDKSLRYGELKKSLPKTSDKMLSKELKDLEDYGIISRKAFLESPPRVEYSLTKKGEKLKPIFGLMRKWGSTFKVVSDVNATRIKKD
jgi:DNA-binding HxlR family transcriptional regulator